MAAASQHTSPREATLRLRVVLPNGTRIGPGKVELIESIVAGGSILAASRALRMSYQRAWTLVDDLNRGFRSPVVAVSRGGAQRGGATVTELGLEIVRLYRAIESNANEHGAAELAHLGSLATDDLKTPSK